MTDDRRCEGCWNRCLVCHKPVEVPETYYCVDCARSINMKKAARSQQAASVCGISVPPSYSETTQQSTSRPKEKEVTNADCSICGQQLSFSVINQRESASIAANVRVGTATCPVCDARYRIRITKIRDSNLSRDELRILRRQQDQAKETKHDPQSS